MTLQIYSKLFLMHYEVCQLISSLPLYKISYNSRSLFTFPQCLDRCCACLCETEIWAMHEFTAEAKTGSKNLFSFVSPFSLYCNVVVLVLCIRLFLSCLPLGLGCLSLLVSKSCADWSRSPLAHGCRSTHNSPVHSACSSQRLSQNFSVSVPTLIFTGTEAGKTEEKRLFIYKEK